MRASIENGKLNTPLDFGFTFPATCQLDSCKENEFCMDEGGVVECLPLIESGGPCFEDDMCDSGKCKLAEGVEEDLGECA